MKDKHTKISASAGLADRDIRDTIICFQVQDPVSREVFFFCGQIKKKVVPCRTGDRLLLITNFKVT